MCYNTCVRKYGKIRHSVDCPLFTHFGNGDPIPFDWHRLDFAEKFRLKQKFAYKKARPYVGGKQVAFQAYVGRKLRDHLASFGAVFEDVGVGAMDEL